nr:prepilin-type N-terminal cleavage/methylation domain-containing protein [uncultured Duganella sp.]
MTTSRVRPRRCPSSRQRGFTLVEAVVVMVVTAILATTMVLFIRRPVQNYADAAARADLSDAADLALRRMARELRGALPNSVRLTVAGGVSWLEFIPTVAGGKYLAAEDNPDPLRGTPLSFTSGTAQPFNVIGSMQTFALAPGANFIVIYNLGPGFDGADAYARDNLALITGFNAANRSLSYESYAEGLAPGNGKNPFVPSVAGRLPNVSPGQRFQVVTNPVTFRCAPSANGRGTLSRSVNAFAVAQPRPALAAGSLLADNVVGCNFTIATVANRQTALIGLNLALGRADANGGNAVETVTLSHQIHVDNTP